MIVNCEDGMQQTEGAWTRLSAPAIYSCPPDLLLLNANYNAFIVKQIVDLLTQIFRQYVLYDGQFSSFEGSVVRHLYV